MQKKELIWWLVPLLGGLMVTNRVRAEQPLPTLADKTVGLVPTEGFFTIFCDDEAGKIWLQIENWEQDFLYVSGLSSGLGSNPVGLDRGRWGRSRVVRFKRVGGRVYLVERNLRYRGVSTNPAERQAVQDSFADSVLWAADIAARTEDRCLVDVSSLLLRDANGVIGRLKASEQGDYKLAADRSFVLTDRCRSFPRNTELEATLTFSSDKAGPLVSETAAAGEAFSLRLHHSLVALPRPGYRPRVADPRVGLFKIAYSDYSAPLDAPLVQRFITRHRLEKAEPEKAKSRPVNPIIYYLDPGVPQPVREALLDGARWWNAAFEEAGFIDGFQVRMLPADADPMDIRFNIIQWVHRSTRGWSYGQSLVDPRTGEIIKGHVLLGSLRVRQDRLIIDGLTSAQSRVLDSGLCGACGIAGCGADHALAYLDPGTGPLDVSLARLRQLSAHEVGHTLGFAHNFAASTYGDRASVMDYPAPRVTITDTNQLDLSDAYGVGVGDWDRLMVRYAYSSYQDATSEAAGLAQLIQEMRERGMIYLSDADARPAGAAHPLANLWDNGSDPIAQLNHVMNIRRLAIQQLDAGDVISGQPLADLEMVLVPIYLYHRYQVAATAKMIGGFDYQYAASDVDGPPVEPVAIERQQRALDALLKTLTAAELQIPEKLLGQLPPKPYPSLEDIERFPARTAMVFDPLAAAQIAAEQTVSQLLQPERAARLAAYPQPSWNLRIVFRRIVTGVWQQPVAKDARAREIQRIVQRVLVQQLITLAGEPTASFSVRTAAALALRQLADDLDQTGKQSALGPDHAVALVEQINRFRDRPHSTARPARSAPAPPGSPIGR